MIEDSDEEEEAGGATQTMLDEINLLLDEVLQGSRTAQLLQSKTVGSSLDEGNKPSQEKPTTPKRGLIKNGLPRTGLTVKRIRLDNGEYDNTNESPPRNLEIASIKSMAKPNPLSINGIQKKLVKNMERVMQSATLGNNLTIANVTSLAKEQDPEKGPSEVHYCTLCHETFRSWLQLHLHREAHREDNYFVCNKCEFKGESIDVLKDHVAAEHRNPAQKVFGMQPIITLFICLLITFSQIKLNPHFIAMYMLAWCIVF